MTKRAIMLTHEHLLKRFSSSFDLVNYAIQKARQIILSGKELAPDPDAQILNTAYCVLDAICKGKEEVFEVEKMEEKKEPSGNGVPLRFSTQTPQEDTMSVGS